MIIRNYREKIINAIIYFAENTNKCGMTKLMKLLYFLDFEHFKQTGISVTGLHYQAWERGPVPATLYNELNGNMKDDMQKAIRVGAIKIQNEDVSQSEKKYKKIVSSQKFSDEYFTERELEIMESLVYIFKDASAEEMVETSHFRKLPWHKTWNENGPKSEIDYLLAIDNDEDCIDLDEAKLRMEENAAMEEFFGVV